MGMGHQAVFLDLNGTLVGPLKPDRLEDMTLIPGAVDAVARLSAAGFICPVVTVQSRVGKGLFSLPEFETWFANFAAGLRTRGALVVGPYVCPHRLADPCPCKKPNTLLYDRAATEHQIDPAVSFVIGDSPEDVHAAKRIGARGCLVRTGWAADPQIMEKALPDASVIAESVVGAVDWILQFHRPTHHRSNPS
jgi:D-glycero-D-manno-heptose 1,7-bisphosphate phosphatase